jgi:SHS2 domain-containing protein
MPKYSYMPYEILEHTADIRIKITSKTLEELFKTALKVMAEIIQPEPEKKSKKIKSKKISLTASNITILLIDFLNEVLTLSNINKTVYSNLKIKTLSNTKLICEIQGMPIKEFKEDIKAVTFHEANVIKNEKGQWETNIIFDI